MTYKYGRCSGRETLALAILLAAATPVNAGGQVYGIADAYVGTVKPSGASGSVVGLGSGGMSLSFWGVAGSEDLGNGLKANFRLEGFYQIDTGASGKSAADSLLSRNAYVGIEGRLGELRIGRLSNPTYLATAQFDPFGGSTVFSPVMNPLWVPSFGRYIASDTAWSNAIGYYTPEFAGVSGRFVYSFGEVSGTNSSNNAVAMLYLNRGPLAATISFQRTRVGPGLPTGSWAQSVLVAGAAYDFGWIKPILQYDATRASGTTFRTDTFMVGANIPFLVGKVALGVTQTNVRSSAQAEVRRRDAAVGYIYPLSKRTDIYGNVLYDKLGNLGSGITAGIGMRHKF